MFRCVLFLLALAVAAPVPGQTPEDHIRRLAQEYAKDPALTAPVTFGIRVDDEVWTIDAVPAAGESETRVTVKSGAPEVPAGMSHEFWNPGDTRGTMILIMFGENA